MRVESVKRYLKRNYNRLPEGCKYCIKGEKLVLFITGLCKNNCYYCPLSDKRRKKDVIYANERLINSVNEAIEEAKLCSSRGVGITGGDPLLKVDRTIKYLKALKNHFKEFHSHLYTVPESITEEKLKLLSEYLDEIRLHPTKIFNEGYDEEYIKFLLEKIELCKKYIKHVGVEIPSIPNMEKEILSLAYAIDGKADFMNINELEFSDTNYDELIKRGFEPKDDISNAIKGSEETALKVIKKFKGKMFIHYCPSVLKDAIQLKNRLINRAKNVAKPYEVITDEGLLLRGIMIFDKEKDMKEIIEILKDNEVEFEVKENKIYLNPFILEDLIKEMKRQRFPIKFSAYISEVYPTADALEVERIPLITKKLRLRRC
ncbi:radical SAM domain-containing protein [Methanocaldococcus villosus KIN24-T80]|uniref:Radical SAM domain-containing protein n=1 Tax=Methanocaldococcus villosus KIN24-T80 TaxID=1069083 RepID=N6VZ99_9EURY|nr:radical SAM protein [Methanocaldococcus villosus]ENN96447.1 radical SAM domain-containing protein [Methanocaldococcus villosus KIN24-T80]